jgi:hypothetical protein
MIPTVCRFGFHSWPKWANDAEMVITVYPYGIKSPDLTGPSKPALRQKRICEGCGKLQYRVAKIE